MGWWVEAVQLSAEQRDGVLVVTISGDLDIMTSPQLDECLVEARDHHRTIILDLSAVDFMDTSALAVIVRHWKKLESAGGSLILAGARYRYTKTLWITGLAERLTLHDGVEEALAAVRGRVVSDRVVSAPAGQPGQHAGAPGTPRS
jgi:anti-sigma B factor antagonist